MSRNNATWQSVAGPNLSGLEQFSALVRGAIKSGTDTIEGVEKARQEGAVGALLQRSLQHSSPEALQAAMANGSLTQGIDPRYITPDFAKTIDARVAAGQDAQYKTGLIDASKARLAQEQQRLDQSKLVFDQAEKDRVLKERMVAHDYAVEDFKQRNDLQGLNAFLNDPQNIELRKHAGKAGATIGKNATDAIQANVIGNYATQLSELNATDPINAFKAGQAYVSSLPVEQRSMARDVLIKAGLPLNNAEGQAELGILSNSSVLNPSVVTEESAASQPTVTTKAPIAGASKDQELFIQSMLPHAQKAASKLGVPVEAIIAQAALESGWGKSRLSAEDGNLFGMKAGASRNNAGTVIRPTKEFGSTGQYVEDAKFPRYSSPEQQIDDYVSYVQRKYPNAVNTGDTSKFATALKNGGYATDPKYAEKVTNISQVIQGKLGIPTDKYVASPTGNPSSDLVSRALKNAAAKTSDAVLNSNQLARMSTAAAKVPETFDDNLEVHNKALPGSAKVSRHNLVNLYDKYVGSGGEGKPTISQFTQMMLESLGGDFVKGRSLLTQKYWSGFGDGDYKFDEDRLIKLVKSYDAGSFKEADASLDVSRTNVADAKEAHEKLQTARKLVDTLQTAFNFSNDPVMGRKLQQARVEVSRLEKKAIDEQSGATSAYKRQK